jgi:hypothetical protein
MDTAAAVEFRRVEKVPIVAIIDDREVEMLMLELICTRT